MLVLSDQGMADQGATTAFHGKAPRPHSMVKATTVFRGHGRVDVEWHTNKQCLMWEDAGTSARVLARKEQEEGTLEIEGGRALGGVQ